MTGSSRHTCYACGATTTPGEDCWLCNLEQPVLAEIAEVNPFQPPAIAGHDDSGVVSGLLLVTVIVVCGVLSFVAPGLGIPLAIGVLPALIRTITQSQRESSRTGQPVSVGNQVSVFMISIAGVVAACCAAAVAFFAVCAAACFGVVATNNEDLFMVGIVAGAVAALVAAVWSLKMVWARN